MGEDGIDFEEMFFPEDEESCPKCGIKKSYHKVGSKECPSIGIETVESRETEKYFVSEGMRKFGGSFVQCLGETLAHADPNNAQKIKATWPNEWKEYLKRGQQAEQAGEDLSAH